MAGKTVNTASKPHLQAALRSTWRKSHQHQVEQVKRFLRLFILAAITPVADVIFAKHFDWRTLLPVILPIAETTFRQVEPALGAQGADQAPGVTIVPDQVAQPDLGTLTPVGSDPVTPPPPST